MMRCCAALLVTAVLAGGCTHDVIPNTDVEDTSENREVIDFVEQYRQALNARNVGALLRLTSEAYFDDMGTPSTADDLDFGGLSAKLSRWNAEVLDVRYDIRYRSVTFAELDRIFVDFTYTGRFKVRTPDGDRWSRRLRDNRLILMRESGELRILSGM